jgi:hypothetical protein
MMGKKDKDKSIFDVTIDEDDKAVEDLVIKDDSKMPDKKEDVSDFDLDPMGFETIGHLTGEQYWRLEAHQQYIDKAMLSSKNKALLHSLMQKDVQLLQVKLANMRDVCVNAEKGVKDARDGYASVKKDIEKQVGIDFKDVIIDEVTYAIRRDIGDNKQEGKASVPKS